MTGRELIRTTGARRLKNRIIVRPEFRAWATGRRALLRRALREPDTPVNLCEGYTSGEVRNMGLVPIEHSDGSRWWTHPLGDEVAEGFDL